MAEIGFVPMAAGGRNIIKGGFYIGNGAASRFINLQEAPEWVFVLPEGGSTTVYSSGYYEYCGGFAQKGIQNSNAGIVVDTEGFTVTYSGNTVGRREHTNDPNAIYIYFYGI